MAAEKNIQKLSGKTRRQPKAESVPYPRWWRESFYGRQEQFREWRNIAMQVVDRSGSVALFRLLAAFDEVFSLPDCDITATDEEIAKAAGHCGTKTIQRGIASLKDLGLVIAEPIRIRKDDKLVKRRRIRLSVPSDLSGIHIG